MKKIILSISILCNLNNLNAQVVSNFENLALPISNTFWNGSETYGQNTFTSGNAVFKNHITKEATITTILSHNFKNNKFAIRVF